MKNVLLYFVIMFVSFAGPSVRAESSLTDPVSATQLVNTYFTIRPDFRRCVSPVCGGWFVKAVNFKTFICPDLSIKQECYVGTDIIRIPDLSSAQLAELRQAMYQSNVLLQGTISNRVPYGLLVINSAWLSATEQKPEGTFVNLADNGIRCITYPCPSYDALILNKNVIKSLAGVELDQVAATDKQFKQAYDAINSTDGLYMAGNFVEVTGPAGVAQGIQASQFYLKLVNTAAKFCRVTGCSGQVCADTDVITTCEWRPEYACYSSAMCTIQANGDCGWTMDETLKSCLAEASGNLLLQQLLTE